jgi:hypothetical protein
MLVGTRHRCRTREQRRVRTIDCCQHDASSRPTGLRREERAICPSDGSMWDAPPRARFEGKITQTKLSTYFIPHDAITFRAKASDAPNLYQRPTGSRRNSGPHDYFWATSLLSGRPVMCHPCSSTSRSTLGPSSLWLSDRQADDRPRCADTFRLRWRLRWQRRPSSASVVQRLKGRVRQERLESKAHGDSGDGYGSDGRLGEHAGPAVDSVEHDEVAL